MTPTQVGLANIMVGLQRPPAAVKAQRQPRNGLAAEPASSSPWTVVQIVTLAQIVTVERLVTVLQIVTSVQPVSELLTQSLLLAADKMPRHRTSSSRPTFGSRYRNVTFTTNVFWRLMATARTVRTAVVLAVAASVVVLR